MPYNPDGTFSLLNRIGTGYACNNALVPLLGADLDDIASNAINIAASNNSNLLNSTLTPGVLVQVGQIGPCSFLAGDLLIAMAFQEVTTQEATLNSLVFNQLFIATSSGATVPAIIADIIGGGGGSLGSANDATNVTPAQHHYTFKADGIAFVTNPGTYYLTHVIQWDSGKSTPGIAETECNGINLVRIRVPLGTI